MTTYLYLDNYRGFKEAFIPIRQVNFLVGENSTGKTSFLEIFEMFCTPSFWLLEPKFGSLGTQPKHFLDLVSVSSKRKQQFTVGAMELQKNDAHSFYGMLVTYINLDGRPVPKKVSVVDGDLIHTVEGRLWVARKGERYKVRTRKCTQTASEKIFLKAHVSNAGFKERVIPEELQGTPLFFRLEEFRVNEEEPIKVPSAFRTSIVDLAPIRSKPRRTYDAPQTEYSPEGEHTPYVIKKRLSSKSQAEDFRMFLQKVGKESSLFESIGIKSYGKTQLAPFEIKVVLGKSALGLDSVGYGVSQALPVIVEMFVRPNKSTFMVQQPEVHLHPKAQASIGDLMAEFARSESKRFVVETHSDFTIDRFRLNIRQNGAIPSQLLFFERTDNGNKATSIEIGKDGTLDENQPENYRSFFFNESLALLS